MPPGRLNHEASGAARSTAARGCGWVALAGILNETNAVQALGTMSVPEVSALAQSRASAFADFALGPVVFAGLHDGLGNYLRGDRNLVGAATLLTARLEW